MQRGHSNSPPRSSPARLYLSIAAGVLGFICLLVALSDLSVPSTRQVTTTASATLTVSYHYQATVLPDPLYPQGGKASPDTPVFSTVEPSLSVSYQPTVVASRPMKVSITTHPITRLIAVRLWEKNSPLGPAQVVSGVVPGAKLSGATWKIPVSAVASTIQATENSLHAVPNSYDVIVDPQLQAVVSDGGLTKRLDWDPRLRFSISGTTWTAQGGLNHTQDVSFSHIATLPNRVTVMGDSMAPVQGSAIYGLVGLGLIAFAILFSRGARRLGSLAGKTIDQKYGRRIIRTSSPLDALRRDVISVERIESLVQLAEDRELPIFRAEGPGGATYFVVDGDIAYAVKGPAEEPAAQVLVTGAGSSG